MAGADAASVEVGGRVVRLTNLSKVLYPEVGFTKAEVIAYYAAVAEVMVPHLEGRPLTFVRYPNGVDADSFFEKNCPGHRPDWMGVLDGPGGVSGCHLDHPAGLVWAGNQAALEIHAPMARAAHPERPAALVFDLDPGAPATAVECAEVALWIRDVLDSVGLVGVVKTSGSKGLQLYVPLNTPAADHAHASSFALAVGQLLERQHPQRVLVEMAKAKRPNKVFIDWSQNNRAKTTVAPYSLRARDTPTVSTPLTWDEVETAAASRDLERLVYRADDVVERVAAHGDLFGSVLELEQELPGPTG